MGNNKLKDSAALLGFGDNLVDRRKVEIETALGERKVNPVAKKAYEDMTKGERADYYSKNVGKPVGTAARILPTNEEIKNKLTQFKDRSIEVGKAVGDIVTGTPNMIRKIAQDKGWIASDKSTVPVKPKVSTTVPNTISPNGAKITELFTRKKVPASRFAK